MFYIINYITNTIIQIIIRIRHILYNVFRKIYSHIFHIYINMDRSNYQYYNVQPNNTIVVYLDVYNNLLKENIEFKAKYECASMYNSLLLELLRNSYKK